MHRGMYPPAVQEMLRSLDIRNYALIDSLHLEFDSGMSVITGETGAGKSILLGALSLILGQRASIEVLRNASDKCTIEGVFRIAGYGLEDFFEENELDFSTDTILRREIIPSGKSRAFINDTPVQLQQLRDLGEQLVDIHSQHRTLALNAADVQLSLLDEYAGNESLTLKYQEQYRHFRALSQRFDVLMAEEAKDRQERDYQQYLFDELSVVSPQEGESTELQAELDKIRNAETIREGLFFSADALCEGEVNIDSRLRDVIHRLHELARHLPQAGQLAERLESLRIELRDISSEITHLNDISDPEPGRVVMMEERLDLLYRLHKKHAVNDDEGLLHVMSQLGSLLEAGVSRAEELQKISKELTLARKELDGTAQMLMERRKGSCGALEEHILSVLARLGMPEASFRIALDPLGQAGPHGTEKARFLFNANRGGKLMDLGQVASGGERSRLMLAIKSCITQRNILPTIIFDEIDTGVSGEMAHKVGEIMAEMGGRLQLIAITHLPQIAAKGIKHYLVFKEADEKSTFTRVSALLPEERIEAIARMLSGDRITQASTDTARELLKA